MAEYSEHYNLKKPAQEDFYDVDDFNENADKIDTALYAAEQKIGQAAQESTLESVKTDVTGVKADIADVKSNVAAVSNKIGTATDTGGSDKAGTVMGKLNNLISIMISELISKYPPEEYTTAGTYKTTVPSLAKSVTITACGAGGGGGGGGSQYCNSGYYEAGNGGGGGGGGGAAIKNVTYTINEELRGTQISIIVGAAGKQGTGNANGNSGGSTVIGSFVTLSGGEGGKAGTSGTSYSSRPTYPLNGGLGGSGGTSGGTGGGAGGNGGNGATVTTSNDFSTSGSSGNSGKVGIEAGNSGGSPTEGSDDRSYFGGMGGYGGGGGSLNSEFGAGGNGGKGTVYVTGGSEYYSHGDDGKPGYVKLIWNF